MNVLLLSQFFSTTRGGGEYVFSLLARKLAENGNEVWVVTNRIQGEQYADSRGVNVVFVEPTLQYKGGMPAGFLDNVRYAANAVRAGRRLVGVHGIDLIHSNNFAPALAGSFLSLITKRPHITTIHDVFSLCGKDYWKRWAAQGNVSGTSAALAPFFERLSVRLRLDCIHTVSEASRDDLVRFGAKKPIYVIHNAVDEGEAMLPHGPGTNPLQFVFVGRLVFYKNLEVVIDAVSAVKRRLPGIRLVIVGDGPHRSVLEGQVSRLGLGPNVVFAGHVGPREKARIISESAAMVFPSLCEGFGLVILEAFLQGKPVLVSDVRPMSEIVEDGRTGYVVDAHDSSAWADRMAHCAENCQEASGMGENGRRVLESTYSQEIMYEKIMQMYREQV